MSDALYTIGGLRFWTEDEIELREAFQTRMADILDVQDSIAARTALGDNNG